MPDFTVKDPPEYNDKMQMLEPTDRAHADVFNALFEKLLNNEAFLKKMIELLAENLKVGTTKEIEAMLDAGKIEDGTIVIITDDYTAPVSITEKDINSVS
ncbi:MAG: hypothetical protein OSJ61_24295 [Lachnospiraceae bacterium]|nr:hypothetical protein [Lachnospiraceae bacterium]